MNEKANWAARSTLFWAVNDAVHEAVYRTVGVDWALNWTVYGAVYRTVHWTREDEPNHPGLEDFLLDVER
jgi:hypothetical protein